jgi:hypothetical protein
MILGELDEVPGPLDQPSLLSSETLLQVCLERRHVDVNGPEAKRKAGLDVFADAPVPANQKRLILSFEHRFERGDLISAHGGNAGFDIPHPDSGERIEDCEFMVDREGHARGLFAVAQSGVLRMISRLIMDFSSVGVESNQDCFGR